MVVIIVSLLFAFLVFSKLKCEYMKIFRLICQWKTGTNNISFTLSFPCILLAKLGFKLEVNWDDEGGLTVLYLVLLFQFFTDPGVVLAQNHCKLLEGSRSSSGQDLQQSDYLVLSGCLLLQNKSQKRTDYLWMKEKKFIVYMIVAWTSDWTKIVVS